MRSALPDDVAFVLPGQAYLLEDSLETNACLTFNDLNTDKEFV